MKPTPLSSELIDSNIALQVIKSLNRYSSPSSIPRPHTIYIPTIIDRTNMSSTTASDTRLNQPHHWWAWNQSFKRLADAKQIWDIVSGEKEPIELPQAPTSVKEFLTYQEEVTPALTGRARTRPPGSSLLTTTPAEEPATTTLVIRTRDKDEVYRMF